MASHIGLYCLPSSTNVPLRRAPRPSTVYAWASGSNEALFLEPRVAFVVSRFVGLVVRGRLERIFTMKNSALAVLAGTCLTMALCSGWAHAQSNPLPIGEVSPVKSVSCPDGFAPGTACHSGTVSCSGTLDIGFTYGVVNPEGRDGTVVFFNGDEGTTVGFAQYIGAYTPPAHDFQTVQVIWDTPWQDTGNGTGTSLKDAACRPATLMDWLLQQHNAYNAGGMCAQGDSAGSAAIAYSLAEYGAYQYLNHVELESGPVMSDVSLGCNPDSTPITVCPGNTCLTGGQGSWPDSPQYVDGNETSISTWTGVSGVNACMAGNGISQTQYTAWQDMSIVDELTGKQADSTFTYPTTSISGWLCSKPSGCNAAWCQNNSAAQGQLFYQNVTTPVSVYRVNDCRSTEGVEEGTVPQFRDESGLDAIIADMVSQCTVQRKHK